MHETLIITPAIKFTLSKNTSIYIIAIIYLLLTDCIIQVAPVYAKAYLPSAEVYSA